MRWAACLAVLLAMSGCKFPSRGQPRVNSGRERANSVGAGTGAGKNSALTIFDRPIKRVVVRIRVHRITAPRGSFTSNDALWQIASQPLPSADAAMRLADNGLRAAVGLESDRDALTRYIERLADPRMALDELLPDTSRLVDIELGPCDDETVFYFDAAGNLHGRGFVRGQARLRLSFEFRSPLLQDVWLRLVPEIEEPPGPWTWEITEAGARQVREQRRFSFSDLAFEARIHRGGFLLVGPTADIYELPLPGRALLHNRAADGAGAEATAGRESILVISPILTTEGSDPSVAEGGLP